MERTCPVAPVSRMAVEDFVVRGGGEGPKLVTVVGGGATVVLVVINRATGGGVDGVLGCPRDQTGGAEFSLLELELQLLGGQTQVTQASRRAD
jgi:hypothetical protein